MENENKVLESKKKSPIIIIVVILLLMVGCVAVGYFASERGIFKKDERPESYSEEAKDSSEEEKSPVVINYDVDDPKVSKLINHLLSVGFNRGCGTIEKYANNSKVEVKDIDNLSIYHIVESAEFYGKKDSFTLDEMNVAIKKYFYGDISFDPTAIDYKGTSCPQYNYDENTKTFTRQETFCGGNCGPSSTHKVVKATDTDGELILDVKVAFAKDANYYSDYQKINQIGTEEDLFDSSNRYDLSLLSKILDKGGDYRFTFRLVDGNYVFVSSEPVK